MVHRYWSCFERSMGGRKAIAVWWAFCLPAMKNETIERYEATDRHVREDAYFATAATVLDLPQQDLTSTRRRRTGELLRKTVERANGDGWS